MKNLVMEIPERLVRRSSLTPRQVDLLSTYLQVVSHDLTLREASNKFTAPESKEPVKIGSFYRTVQQGRQNIKASILTLTIALWMGLIRSDELRRLLDHVGKGLPELEEGEKERMAALIEALVDKIVI